MNVILTQPVEIALPTLPQDDRRNVLDWIERLKNWEDDEFVRRRAHKLNPVENIYVMNAGGELRIFFKVESQKLSILDIARRDTVLSFSHAPE